MLGIESSCDDTGVAVIRASDGAILGQALAQQARVCASKLSSASSVPRSGASRLRSRTGRGCHQVDIHAPWGGVVPKLAQQAHEAAMDATVAAAMQEAGIAPHDLDAVAVTVGPGLSLCLKVIPLPGCPVSAFSQRFMHAQRLEQASR